MRIITLLLLCYMNLSKSLCCPSKPMPKFAPHPPASPPPAQYKPHPPRTPHPDTMLLGDSKQTVPLSVTSSAEIKKEHVLNEHINPKKFWDALKTTIEKSRETLHHDAFNELKRITAECGSSNVGYYEHYYDDVKDDACCWGAATTYQEVEFLSPIEYACLLNNRNSEILTFLIKQNFPVYDSSSDD